ncbi:MAG: DUF503 domain-containing protein [Thermodesulfobacteriota bacterium]
MIVGVCHLALRFHDCRSLKDKRQRLKSIIGRVRNRFNVSAAEVAALDRWQRAEVGIVAVGADSAFVNSVLDRVLDYVEVLHTGEILDHDIEFITIKPPWADFG